MKKLYVTVLTAALSAALIACGNAANPTTGEAVTKSAVSIETAAERENSIDPSVESAVSSVASQAEQADTVLTDRVTGGALETEDLFSDRDLKQTADLSEAEYLTVKDGQNIEITSEGVYVVSGNAKNAAILVDVSDNEKVQIVLDGVSITNENAPCIYVKNADKVFVTTAAAENSLSVTGTFTADGQSNTDAVIFAKDDLVINGTGTLNICSTDNGITGKDDLKITGGTINIQCASDALEANESIRIADGNITITTKKDGIHVENEEDDSTGYVYICGGTLQISAGDDGIHATTIAQIDGGDLKISAVEGVEATWIQINGGAVNVEASDDGINGSQKSSAYDVNVEINGGDITILMGAGDTDAIDSNGNLTINGGTLTITAQSPFDYDGTAQYNGGTMIINGKETTTITGQFMGPGMGPMGGGPGWKNEGTDPGMGENSGFGPGGFH